MKHWNETEDILARVAELLSLGRTAALATVVGIRGSAYRRPGAKFLVEDDGRTTGGISGGCLEADVREIARDVMRTGTPRLRHYDTGADDRVVWGLGLGCNGAVEVFIQRVDRVAPHLPALRERLRGEDAFAISTIVDGPGTGRSLIVSFPGPASGVRRPASDVRRPASTEHLSSAEAHDPHASDASVRQENADLEILRAASARHASSASGLDELEGRTVFTDVLVPPPHLVVCGAGDDARPVVMLAAQAGFQVTVVDHRPAYLTADRFPAARRLLLMRPDEAAPGFPPGLDTSVVLMTHSLVLDCGWLRRVLATPAAYVGVLGPRDRAEEILRQLDTPRDERVYGPVGLDIGADGPEQIAVAIVAELLSARAGREPRHLRSREVPIHASGS